MNMKKNTIILLILVFFISVSSGTQVSCDLTKDELKHFLRTDPVSYEYGDEYIGMRSSYLTHMLTNNARENGIYLGSVKLYNPSEKRGYVFAYVVINNEFIYIDAETDQLYTYNEATKRLSSGVILTYVDYKGHTVCM